MCGGAGGKTNATCYYIVPLGCNLTSGIWVNFNAVMFLWLDILCFHGVTQLGYWGDCDNGNGIWDSIGSNK